MTLPGVWSFTNMYHYRKFCFQNHTFLASSTFRQHQHERLRDLELWLTLDNLAWSMELHKHVQNVLFLESHISCIKHYQKTPAWKTFWPWTLTDPRRPPGHGVSLKHIVVRLFPESSGIGGDSKGCSPEQWQGPTVCTPVGQALCRQKVTLATAAFMNITTCCDTMEVPLSELGNMYKTMKWFLFLQKFCFKNRNYMPVLTFVVISNSL